MKNFILIIVLILIVFGGFILFGNRNAITDIDSETEMSAEQNMTETNLATGTYSLVAINSTLSWAAERIVGNSHTGTVEIATGQIMIDNGTTTGEFIIDMTTISESNNNTRFLDHVRSDDFFAVEEYPTATLLINSATKTGPNTFDISGDLTIRDITQTITFPATITTEGEAILAIADIVIDRTRWNINFDSGSIFKDIGDRAIRDEVNFSLNLVLSR